MLPKFKSVGCLAAVLALLYSLPALAEQALVLRTETLRIEPFADAKAVSEIGKNARVEVIKKQGAWTLIGASGKQGWVRSLSLRNDTPVVAPVQEGVLALESGRSGHGDLIATTGIRGIAKPTSPNSHALIMTIGAYREGIQPLTGVKHDAETARQIARRMGIPDENIRVLRDDDLTYEGMVKAFDEFESKVQQDEQAFIYYSGHGGRSLVKEEGSAERCAESLITIEGYGFFDTEIEKRLKRLSQKTEKLIFMLDACHSGGVTTRSTAMSTPSSQFTPKFWQPKSADACDKTVNVVTRSAKTGTEPNISGINNYTYIAAARDNEISLDEPGKGGVASQAWLECMSGAARDLDGSGGLSAEEIRACAQPKINQKLANAAGVTPHHVSITGNSKLILGFEPRASTATAAPAAPSPAPSLFSQWTKTNQSSASKPAAASPAPAAVAPVAATAPLAETAPPVVKPNPAATLYDIYNNRDDRRTVELKTTRPKLKIDRDSLEFTLTSSHDGNVYLIMAGSDGTTFDLLFPNQLDKNNLIQAGETIKLPRAMWELTAAGPPGKNTLLAIVTESTRNFSNLGMKPAGPFSVIDVTTVPDGGRDIQLVTGTSSEAQAGDCQMNKTRNLTIKKRCSNAYGAAMLVVEEVK
jgi:Caspase domain/Domain of unknown function (DUF4384)